MEMSERIDLECVFRGCKIPIGIRLYVVRYTVFPLKNELYDTAVIKGWRSMDGVHYKLKN